MVDLVQRCGGGVVPNPGAAIADSLVEQDLVVEPPTHAALGLIERDPERLGLIRMRAWRVELVVLCREWDDFGPVHGTPPDGPGPHYLGHGRSDIDFLLVTYIIRW